jgi:outer membrane protein OmpA-like peptidoglycan-associated protein
MRWFSVIGALAVGLSILPTSQAQSIASEKAISRSWVIDALLPCPDGRECKTIKVSPVRPTSSSAPVMLTFQTGSSELTPNAKRALDVVASGLVSDELSRYRFTIEGHADPRGTEEMNDTLSRTRAEAVRDYLVAQHRIAADRLDPVGRGASRLANEKDPADPSNRRVTFITVTR